VNRLGLGLAFLLVGALMPKLRLIRFGFIRFDRLGLGP
jgi:hypothetical protein